MRLVLCILLIGIPLAAEDAGKAAPKQDERKSTKKVETPFGPCWHRYNHDGYGQGENGAPYVGYGKGRAWPLLTAERGHYELAAGNDVGTYVRALERFASETGLLAEQVWDEPDQPESHMVLGRPTIDLDLPSVSCTLADLIVALADAEPRIARYLRGEDGRPPASLRPLLHDRLLEPNAPIPDGATVTFLYALAGGNA